MSCPRAPHSPKLALEPGFDPNQDWKEPEHYCSDKMCEKSLVVFLWCLQPSSWLPARCDDVDQWSSTSTCSLTKAEPDQLHHQGLDQIRTRGQIQFSSPVCSEIYFFCSSPPSSPVIPGGDHNQVNTEINHLECPQKAGTSV